MAAKPFRKQTVPELLTIELAGGFFFCTLRPDWPHALDAKPLIDYDEYVRLKERADLAHARYKATELLARAANSKSDLRRKLVQRGFGKETANMVLDAMEEEGTVDDERFAESWLRSTLRRKNASNAALSAGLAGRGVSPDVARRALETVLEEGARDEVDRLCQVGDSLRGDYAKVARRLLSRGFPPGAVRQYVETRFRSEDSFSD